MEILIGLCFLAALALFGGLTLLAFILAAVRLMRGPTTGAAPGAAPGPGLFGGLNLRSWIPSGLLSSGTPARGILLAVASTGTRTTYYGQRCEIRRARVDIEARGMAPFVIDTNVYIPTNLVRDVLPGSTMELRINPTNQTMVLVVGPDVGYAQGSVRTA